MDYYLIKVENTLVQDKEIYEKHVQEIDIEIIDIIVKTFGDNSNINLVDNEN